MKRIVIALVGIFWVFGQLYAAEPRQIINEDGTFYTIDPQNHRVYSCFVTTNPDSNGNADSAAHSVYCVSSNQEVFAVSELNHTLQIGGSSSDNGQLPHPTQSNLGQFQIPIPPANSTPISDQNRWNDQTTAENMLQSTTVGLGGPQGYTPSVPLTSGQAAHIMQCANNLFGPGVPVNDYSGIRDQANKFAEEAAKEAKEVQRLKELKSCSKADLKNPLTENYLRQFQERKIIDLPSIPDPEENQLPYQFQSQGQTRDELVRLYQRLYKIKPEGGKRTKTKEMGLESVEQADQAFQKGKVEKGNFYKDLAVEFLDLAIGLDPITSAARSSYELITGRNFVTGVKLSEFDRSLAFVNLAAMGTGGMAKNGVKAISKFTARLKIAFTPEAKIAMDLAIQNGGKAVESAEKTWQSVKGLVHTVKGNFKRGADGTFKLKSGMHTERGFGHFLKLNTKKGKNYEIQSVTAFGERNLNPGVILKEQLPNGVTRLQLPRDSWHNSNAFDNAKAIVDGQNLKGVKTLWPESFLVSDIAEATESVLTQNIGNQAHRITGTFRGISVKVLKDRTTGKVNSVFPAWKQ